MSDLRLVYRECLSVPFLGVAEYVIPNAKQMCNIKRVVFKPMVMTNGTRQYMDYHVTSSVVGDQTCGFVTARNIGIHISTEVKADGKVPEAKTDYLDNANPYMPSVTTYTDCPINVYPHDFFFNYPQGLDVSSEQKIRLLQVNGAVDMPPFNSHLTMFIEYYI